MPAPQNPNNTRFEAEIGRYNQWREELTQSVHEYHDWLEGNGHLEKVFCRDRSRSETESLVKRLGIPMK